MSRPCIKRGKYSVYILPVHWKKLTKKANALGLSIQEFIRKILTAEAEKE